MKTFSRFSIVLIVFSLFALYSCGKKDTGSTDSKSSDSKTSTDSKSESSGNKSISASDDFTIKYELSGKVKGDVTTYKKGKKVKQEMTMNVEGVKMKTNSYFDDKYAYMVMDLMGKKMGTKIDIAKYKEEGAKEGKDLDYNNMAEYLKDKKKVGTETILGRECDIYETGKGVKISVSKEMIPLKIATEPMTMVATAIEKDVKLSDDELSPPSGVDYTEIKSLNQKMAK